MPFSHSCFISYCHGQGDIIAPFIGQLRDALNSCLDPYLDERVYLDSERLRPGYRFNESIARALCESICMVLVYVPKYERHEYCLRELSAMERLEQRRFALLGDSVDRRLGFIIPVVLRGRLDDLPSAIRNARHFCDFSRYTTASPEIGRTADYAARLDEIAEYVYRLSEGFRRSGIDPCGDCHSFRLPPGPTALPSRVAPNPPRAFPFRK